ncbi:MAG: glycosyltransferase [bacterium]|nr:glycosyltransferase [bacterium]
MTPLISVYITNHNYGKYITQSIESVLHQTIQDFELIIIDDGSTDNSRDIINTYQDNPKIKVIFQQNKGLNVTNNIALRAAKGKYIMRLDADDYLDHNALLVMSNLLEKDSELGMIFPDYYLVDEENTILGLEKRHDFTKEVELLDQPAHGACTMIRRDFLLSLNGYNEDYSCQDGYELWIKFISAYKVRNINTALFFYRRHGANLTGNEERILTTRAKIKDDYLDQSKTKTKSAAIIPIRGENSQNHTTAFEQIGDKTLLDWKIQELLKSDRIDQVLVTSPSEQVKKHIESNYTDERVIFHNRGESLAQLNIDLHETITDLLKDKRINKKSIEYLLVLGIEFPFISQNTINDSINSAQIFEADSLISVRPETNLFFQHDGAGMKPILNMEKFTRLEREAIYKYTGGIMLSKLSFFDQEKKLLGGKVGHIVIGQRESHGIFTKYDLNLARLIVDDQTKKVETN